VPTSLPERVIYVGTPGSDPRLYISQGETANYIALSHCCFIDETPTTERATVPERLQGIRFDILPKMFQDAISITRILDIEYIWIDSLCIIQDDSEDWEVQSTKMNEIYENSFLEVTMEFLVFPDMSFLKW